MDQANANLIRDVFNRGFHPPRKLKLMTETENVKPPGKHSSRFKRRRLPPKSCSCYQLQLQQGFTNEVVDFPPSRTHTHTHTHARARTHTIR